jgi:hypothetical protein
MERHIVPLSLSNPSQYQENDYYQKDQSYSAGWIISPARAMPPARQSAEKREEQEHDQYGFKHCRSFLL